MKYSVGLVVKLVCNSARSMNVVGHTGEILLERKGWKGHLYWVGPVHPDSVDQAGYWSYEEDLVPTTPVNLEELI